MLIEMTPAPRVAAQPPREPLVLKLARDWAEIERVGERGCWCQAAECWCSWAGNPSECLARLDSGDDHLALHLLAAARSGQVPAARVVLQALLPRLQLLGGPREGVAQFLGLAWERVLRYRPSSAHQVLDNLARSCRRTALSESGRAAVRGLDLERIPEPPGVGSPDFAGALIRDAFGRGLVDSDTAELLHDVYITGMTSRDAGACRGLSAETVRDRCRRALARMRVHHGQSPDVA